jgi:hypothetical protein
MAALDANPAEVLCANAVAGNDKATKANAIFSAVFDIEKFLQVHGNAEACGVM